MGEAYMIVFNVNQLKYFFPKKYLFENYEKKS